MAENQLTMFGKTYNTVGSANNNLILQTRGDLKVRWGNKFIDLIKNGKIAVDVDFLKKVDSKDNITTDGIYLVKNDENNEIWVNIGGEIYNLYGEISSDYVSFIKPQETNSEQKYQALQNIGLCYNTYQEAYSAKIQQGIVYCEDTKKLYTVNEGILTEYTLTIQWPEQLTLGNIIIDGTTNTIYANGQLYLGIGTNRYIECSDNNIKLLKSIILQEGFRSYDFNDKGGFAIQLEDGQYTLIIDSIRVRNSIGQESDKYVTYEELYNYYQDQSLIAGCYYIITDFQNEWELTSTIYTKVQSELPENPQKYYDNTGVELGNVQVGHDINVRPIKIQAKSSSEFETICHFVDNPEWDLEYDINFRGYVFKQINGVDTRIHTKGRITKLTDERNNTANFDFKHKTFKIQNDINNNNLEYDEEYCYMFNQSNPDYYRVTPRIHPSPFLSRHYHKYRDSSQYDERIKNNTIKLRKPIIEPYTEDAIVINKDTGESTTVTNTINKITLYDDYVIFKDERVFNNDVGFTGKYIINDEFNGNSFRDMDNCVLGPNCIMKNCTFTGSTLENSTINGLLSNCAFGYVYNVTINGDLINCSFGALTGCPIEDGTFNIVGPLDNIIARTSFRKSLQSVETDVANARENVTDSSIIEPISTFDISTDIFPKLGKNGIKRCNIEEKVYEGVTYNVFVVELSANDNAPVGVIVMFNGLIANIPSGWVICDGTNGTPDLRGRFIRMIDIGEQCGPQNNSDLVSRTIQQDGQNVQTRQMYLNKTVKHTHVYKTYSEQITADYSGLSFQYETNSLDISGLTVNGSTLSYIQHTTSGPNPQAAIGYFASSGTPVYSKAVNITHDSTKHSISGSIGNMPAIEVTGDIYVNIEMTPEQDAEPDFPEYINVEPQAYALIFIMKIR